MRFLITTGLGRNRALSCWVTWQEANQSDIKKFADSIFEMVNKIMNKNTRSPLLPVRCAASSSWTSWYVRWQPRFHVSCRRLLSAASPCALGLTRLASLQLQKTESKSLWSTFRNLISDHLRWRSQYQVWFKHYIHQILYKIWLYLQIRGLNI